MLFLVDSYDQDVLLKMARQQQLYVATLTGTPEMKKRMTPVVDAGWDPDDDDDFHAEVAQAIAVTNSEFTGMTADAVKACISRPRLEIEARNKKIVTLEMKAGLKDIKAAILGEAPRAQAQQGDSSVLAQVQADMAKTLKKVVDMQAKLDKGEKGDEEEYEMYGGKKGGVLGMEDRYKKMGYADFKEWLQDNFMDDWKKVDAYTEYGKELNEALDAMRRTRNGVRSAERQLTDPDEDHRTVVAQVDHVKLEWVKACEKVMLYHNCWTQAQNGETEAMKHVVKEYHDKQYGIQENARITKMNEAARKKVREQELKDDREFLSRERLKRDWTQVQGQHSQREVTVVAVQDRQDGRRDRHSYTQLPMTARRRVEEVFASPAQWMQGKLVSVGDREVFINDKRDLSVAAVPGYTRVFPTDWDACCRECGKQGHEAWECKSEYEYMGWCCIPPLLLYPQYVNKTAQVKNAEREGGPRRGGRAIG